MPKNFFSKDDILSILLLATVFLMLILIHHQLAVKNKALAVLKRIIRIKYIQTRSLIITSEHSKLRELEAQHAYQMLNINYIKLIELAKINVPKYKKMLEELISKQNWVGKPK